MILPKKLCMIMNCLNLQILIHHMENTTDWFYNSDNAVQSWCTGATLPNPFYSDNSQSSTVIYEGLDDYIKN